MTRAAASGKILPSQVPAIGDSHTEPDCWRLPGGDPGQYHLRLEAFLDPPWKLHRDLLAAGFGEGQGWSRVVSDGCETRGWAWALCLVLACEKNTLRLDEGRFVSVNVIKRTASLSSAAKERPAIKTFPQHNLSMPLSTPLSSGNPVC